MVNDIRETSVWDKLPFLKPYALLARWDRPIGVWLLFWPCVWGMALAPSFKTAEPVQQLTWIILFFIGSIVMRGAGCTINDILDRDLDGRVQRTKTRPLASGQITLKAASAFLVLQLAIGAVILFQLSSLAIILGLCSLPLIATYPLMKRITWGPQFFLGLNFAAGVPIGWAAVENSLAWPAIILYVAGILWVVAYDTVYAHMDSEDDAVIGIKSTALWWGLYSKHITGWLWLGALGLFATALALAGANGISYVMLGLAAFVLLVAHAFWRPENAGYSLRFFLLQHRIGLILALSAMAPVLFP